MCHVDAILNHDRHTRKTYTLIVSRVQHREKCATKLSPTNRTCLGVERGISIERDSGPEMSTADAMTRPVQTRRTHE